MRKRTPDVGVIRVDVKRGERWVALGRYGEEFEARLAYMLGKRTLAGVCDSVDGFDEATIRAHVTPDRQREIERYVARRTSGYVGHIAGRGEYSRYVGVSFDRNRELYVAHITLNRVQIALGRYDDEYEAATAYNVAKTILRGGDGPNEIPAGAISDGRRAEIEQDVRERLKAKGL